MKSFMNKSLDAARKYNVLDWAVIKICLVGIGILLGVYFIQFFSSIFPIVWMIVIITWLWVMIKTFVTYWR